MRFNTICPYCNKELVGFDYENREQVKLDSLGKIKKARVVDSEIQYVQHDSKSPVQLFHLSCFNKANNIK